MLQSSELAGGDGFTFEGFVAAYYLAALLAKRKTSGCDGTVIEVAVQQRNFGKPLDDVIVKWKDNSKRVGVTSLQVKKELIISSAKKNNDFREVIRDSWNTFKSNDFQIGLDKYGAAVGNVALQKFRDITALCEMARESNEVSHFSTRLTSECVSKTQLEISNDIKKIVLEENGIEPTIKDLREFLAHFIIVKFDFLHGGEVGSSEAELYLNEILKPHYTHLGSLVWSHLHTIIRKSAAKSGVYNFDRIINELAKIVDLRANIFEGTKPRLLQESINYIEKKFSYISILGIRNPIALKDCWIPLKATIIDEERYESTNLEVALKKYHEFYEIRRKDESIIDASTFGRYIKKAVVIGGPGIGKSTLMKKLALTYSKEKKFVVFIKLSTLATLLEQKIKSFEDTLLCCGFEHTLENTTDFSIFEEAIILGDGLDECGGKQKEITDAFFMFSQKYPASTILLSSRPIGYDSGLIGGWRHYQLQPIEESEINNAVTTIIKALPNENNVTLSEKIDFVIEQIKSKYVKGLAARSPLILTLISVLASKKIEIGTNRASLYRQFFSLIEKTSTDREINSFVNSTLRNEFLYILGFIISCEEFKSKEEIIEEIIFLWRKKSGESYLELIKIVEESIIYWEQRGIIETVQTFTDSTITFIHKTFCEFCFAKYIQNISIAEQEDMLKKVIINHKYKEVLSFLSHLGFANKIIALLSELNRDNLFKISEYLEIIIDSSIDWESENVEFFLNLCWTETNNYLSSARYSSGAAICLAAIHCWEKVEKEVMVNLDHNDAWVRIVAWTSYLGEKNNKINGHNLIKSLDFFKLNFPESNQFTYFNNPRENVKEFFLINITQRLLSEYKNYPLLIDELNNFYLSEVIDISIGLIGKLEEIFNKYDVKFLLNEKYNSSSLEFFNKFNEFTDCYRNFFSIFLVDVEIDSIEIDEFSKDFLEMGAFIKVIGMMEASFRSIAIFKQPIILSKDIRVILFKKISELAGINYLKLQQQAKIKIIQSKNDSEYFSLFYDIPHVDIDPIFKDQYLSAEIYSSVEAAILTGNSILAGTALKIALGFVESDKFSMMVEKLIKLGEGKDLFYSSYLGQYLPKENFQRIILEKLTRSKLTVGCNHLYPHLDHNFDRKIFLQAIYNGLEDNNPDIAKAAAQVIKEFDCNSNVLEKLKQYYQEWQLKEMPYPRKGGTVPTTPREKLAEIIVKFDSNNIGFLQEMAIDDRPNIRKLVIKPLVNLAKENISLREWIIEEVSENRVDLQFVEQSVTEKLYEDDYDDFMTLFDHKDSKIRYAAMCILEKNQLPNEIVLEKATRLLSDSVLEIRERANNILHNLNL
ncbi:NACHT domain-containing protein [Acinetobacter calcoaceticus]|uniref:NACHT domain-containing protein n=1 Tax=Acinetobacter calcoaceticus TaxID=471 RepID=UPI002275A9D4|nr:NACHT domain-containing protein [Acinetobacter calcoaceticus]GLG84611.1 hypothetical protein ACSO1_31350 [Acinetobacter calcoaceticus]